MKLKDISKFLIGTKVNLLIVPSLLIVSLIINITYTYNSFTSRNHLINKPMNNISFGIKYPFPQGVKKKIILDENQKLDLESFKNTFLQSYNLYVNLNEKNSKAFSNNERITLSINQSTWDSTWFVDLNFNFVRSSTHEHLIDISFDFIYGPNENIFRERLHGDLAKDAILKIVREVLETMGSDSL